MLWIEIGDSYAVISISYSSGRIVSELQARILSALIAPLPCHKLGSAHTNRKTPISLQCFFQSWSKLLSGQRHCYCNSAQCALLDAFGPPGLHAVAFGFISEFMALLCDFCWASGFFLLLLLLLLSLVLFSVIDFFYEMFPSLCPALPAHYFTQCFSNLSWCTPWFEKHWLKEALHCFYTCRLMYDYAYYNSCIMCPVTLEGVFQSQPNYNKTLHIHYKHG